MGIEKEVGAGLLLVESGTGEQLSFALVNDDDGAVLSRVEFDLKKLDAFGRACATFRPWLRGLVFEGKGKDLAKIMWTETLNELRQRGYREILLPSSYAEAGREEARLAEAKEAGFVADVAMPEFFFPTSTGRRAIRLLDIASPPEGIKGFGECYAQALDSVNFGPEAENEISAMDSRLVNLLREELASGGFYEEYGVSRVLSIGSTDRHTYGWLPVDFDIMVETALPRERLDQNRVRDLTERLARKIEILPELADYLRKNPGWRPDHRPKLLLKSLGLRGQASLVARLDVVLGDEVHDRSCSFLDITFADVTRPSDYAIWVKRYLARLSVDLRQRLILELRLTKRCLKLLEDVYGSEEIGLRPITIEQMVIQHLRYRASGILVGTFDGVMQHLCEEGTEQTGDRLFRIIQFADFKRSFPIWRPGMPQDDLDAGTMSEQINLLDLLANGNQQRAQEKWEKIVTLAVLYQQTRRQGKRWTTGGLIQRAQEAYRTSETREDGRVISVA